MEKLTLNETALSFDKWKYLFMACTATVCICFSISFGLNAINDSVKSINTGLRGGIDSVKGLQQSRNAQANRFHDDISHRLDVLEQKIDDLSK